MSPPLLAEERGALLDIAVGAIWAQVVREEPPPLMDEPSLAPRLREKRGAFVTITRAEDGSLRGCVGYVNAAFPLCETVARAALAAACEDHRFAPVTRAEFRKLAVEISVLGELRPLKPERVEVGTHGLMIRCSGRSGLLLPQVPVEHGWDRATFLEETCRKAGLPRNAWGDPTTEILGFTAEVFGRPVGKAV